LYEQNKLDSTQEWLKKNIYLSMPWMEDLKLYYLEKLVQKPKDKK